jgi:hypothetical protein
VIGILMRAASYRFYAYINSFLETADLPFNHPSPIVPFKLLDFLFSILLPFFLDIRFPSRHIKPKSCLPLASPLPVRPPSPGRLASLSPLRISRLLLLRPTRSEFRSTTLVFATQVCFFRTRVIVLPELHRREKDNRQLMLTRCLHTLWQGSRRCFPYCPRTRGCRYCRVHWRGRHQRQAW